MNIHGGFGTNLPETSNNPVFLKDFFQTK